MKIYVFDDRQYLSLFVKERINQSIKDEKNDSIIKIFNFVNKR